MDFSQIMNIILAIFAFGTLITAILTFRQTKEFEKQRIRPMMQAHLRMAEDPFSCAELVISNPGQTIAHNVKFEFIPDLPKPPPEKPPSQQNPSMASKPTRHHPATTPRRTNPNLGPRLRNNNAVLVPQRKQQIRRLRTRNPRQNHNQNQLHRRLQKTNLLQRHLRTQRRTTLRHRETQNPSTQNPNRPTKHSPRTKITTRRLRLPPNRHQQQILKPHNPHTLPDSTARRVGILSYSWHLTADPATKSDNN